MDHALRFCKGGLVLAHHKYVTDEWGVLFTDSLTPKYFSSKLFIFIFDRSSCP